MKRIILLSLAVSVLLGCAGCRNTLDNTSIREESVEEEKLSFPCQFANSQLTAEKTVSYDGAFWEDGSGQMVADVAGLILFNPTDRMIEYAACVIQQGTRRLYFFVHQLPPNSRCLVPEFNKKSWDSQQITQCDLLSVRWSRQEFSREQIHYVGLGTRLTLVNRENREISGVKVHYKRYEKEGDYYLGGVAYCAYVHCLLPEEQRMLLPAHYDTSHTRIVGIELEI